MKKLYLVDVWDNKKGYLYSLDDEYETKEEAEYAAKKYEKSQKYHWSTNNKAFDYCTVSEIEEEEND